MTAQEHLSGYQTRDYDIVDYGMYELAGTGLWFRGPALPGGENRDYFTCIGAAQTFGCLCARPFPALLSERLGLSALNLGYGGAGPEFFARQDRLFQYVNRGRFAVVQVMSGRSQSNSLFECGGLEYLLRRSDGMRMGADEAYRELLAGPRALRNVPPRRLTRRLARLVASTSVRRAVLETRAAWVESYRRLLAQIHVPTMLFWYSQRPPDYVESLRNVNSLFGDFPQLVNGPMVHEVRGMCGGYVECVTRRGSPQLLVSRFTGQPATIDPARDRADLGRGEVWTHNSYYPSPEMHEDAAAALAAACPPK